MKKKIISLCFSLLLLLSSQTFSQGPGEAYNPMTANGAEGVLPGQWFTSNHYLKWKNPVGTIYNEVYLSDDSLLVALLDTSTRILNGFPSTVFNETIPTYPNYEHFKKYFWRVIEHGSGGISLGPIWYYRTRVYPGEIFEENFDSLNINQWTVVGPNGFNNWSLGFSGQASNDPPELEFSWSPAFTGNSHIKINKILPGGYGAGISFDHYIDWYTDTVMVGLAIKNINESEWTSIWEKRVTNNYGPTNEYINLSWNEEIFNLAFYFSGNSFNINYWYIDNIFFSHPIETYDPPGFLQVLEDSVNQKVTLNWTPGYQPGPLSYNIKRKIGLPTDTTSYSTVGYACNALISYEDYDVQPNTIYTYRVHTVFPCPNSFYTSIGGNEATAYLQNIVPVELQSFDAEVTENKVNLTWSTATETNNSGFEIIRSTQNDNAWENIGFVPGFGTTTEVHHYSFIDEALQSGNYQYRLKQIDFDGSFEYSNIIEVAVDAPTKFSLEQNYPNPFNPTTKIKFTIPAEETRHASSLQVTLKVYDVLGNEVVTLVDEQKPAGTYEVEFNVAQVSRPELSSGISAKGGYASGIYFYQLQADKFLETKKMIILK
jgi:hypothetical protein